MTCLQNVSQHWRRCVNRIILGSDDSKGKVVEKLCRTLQLDEPDEIEKFDGDLSVIPTQLQEISKLPVFKLEQYLHHFNIPWSGSKVKISWLLEFWRFEPEQLTAYFKENVTVYWG